MARHSTVFVIPQLKDDENSPLDQVEAGLMAKMELGEAQKERHRHGHEHEHGKKRKPRVEAVKDDVEEQPVLDARSAQRTKKKEKKKTRETLRDLERSVFQGVAVDLSLAKRMAEARNPQSLEKARESSVDIGAMEGHQAGIRVNGDQEDEEADAKVSQKRKRNSELLISSKHLATQVIEPKQIPIINEINENADREQVRKDEKQRRRDEERAAKKFLEGSKYLGEGSCQVASDQEIVVDTPPKKKNKFDVGASQEKLHSPGHNLYSSNRLSLTNDIQKSTSNEKKRKLDRSSQTSLLQLNSGPVQDFKSPLTSTIEACLPVKAKAAEDNNNEDSTNKKKTKTKHKLDQSSQESPPRLHTPPSLKHTIVETDDICTDRVPGHSKQMYEKNAKKRLLVPSILLTPAAKANVVFLQTVNKECGSHISSSNPLSEEASKASITSSNSISSDSSSEDENQELPRKGSATRPPQLLIGMSGSPSPIRPMKAVANEVKKETAILPPKRLIQTATRTPINLTEPVRAKKAKVNSTADCNHKDEACTAEARKAFTSKASETAKASQGDIFSQTVASLKEATTTKIHDLFSDVDDSREEEPPSLVVDSIKKSSPKLQSLFSPKADSASTSVVDKKRDIHTTPTSTFVKHASASEISASLGQPLILKTDGINSVSNEWEATVGKVRGSAQGDDTEAQENIAFSSTYIASRATGIKISNTTFQAHNLRHAEGWVVSSSLDTTAMESRNSGSTFKLKICTVISGRVHVRLGKDAFCIGKGGVFRVKSGEECVVRNGEKKGAVLWVVCVE